MMKPVRVKQKRDFWRRNKRSEKKSCLLFHEYLELSSETNRKGMLSSSLILHPLTVHLFLSTIPDWKNKPAKSEETTNI